MTPMRSSASTVAILACLAVSLSACAGDPGRRPQRPGGRGAPDKARASVFISPAGQPFRAPPGQPYPVGAWFAQADKDHDGRLTREEFRADFEAFFRVLDANSDGVIDGFELSDYEKTVAPEILSDLERPTPQAQAPANTGGQGGGGGRGGGGGGRGGGGGGRGGGGGGRGGGQGQGGGQGGAKAGGGQAATQLTMQGAAAFSLLNVSEPVAGADANFDGRVTLQEFLAAADRRFDMLDPKGLGYLTLGALPRTPAQIAIEGKKPAAK
jgi:hypothetical protein